MTLCRRTRPEAGRNDAFRREVSDIVRVVAMGEYAKELCGDAPGQHAESGLFKIIGEESIQGIRASRP